MKGHDRRSFDHEFLRLRIPDQQAILFVVTREFSLIVLGQFSNLSGESQQLHIALIVPTRLDLEAPGNPIGQHPFVNKTVGRGEITARDAAEGIPQSAFKGSLVTRHLNLSCQISCACFEAMGHPANRLEFACYLDLMEPVSRVEWWRRGSLCC
jgi:hypothetical protein